MAPQIVNPAPPLPRVVSQAEACRYLRKQIMLDAIKCGWIAPCAVKHGEKLRTKYYRRCDVEAIEQRLLSGEYPQPQARETMDKIDHILQKQLDNMVK